MTTDSYVLTELMEAANRAAGIAGHASIDFSLRARHFVTNEPQSQKEADELTWIVQDLRNRLAYLEGFATRFNPNELATMNGALMDPPTCPPAPKKVLTSCRPKPISGAARKLIFDDDDEEEERDAGVQTAELDWQLVQEDVQAGSSSTPQDGVPNYLILPKDDPQWKRWSFMRRQTPSIWCCRMMPTPVRFYVTFVVTTQGSELDANGLPDATPTEYRRMVVEHRERFWKSKVDDGITTWKLDVYCKA